jgi:hypothetical protein
VDLIALFIQYFNFPVISNRVFETTKYSNEVKKLTKLLMLTLTEGLLF